MFTGIVTDIGTVEKIEQRGDLRVTIATRYDADTIDLGASIMCSGVCLTVISRAQGWFCVDVSAETLDKTTFGDLATGTKLNLERSLRMGDELGGHIVTGHVDGVATVLSVRPEGDSLRFEIEAPEHLAKFIAAKGSVALDGTSLTVNDVAGSAFGINIIPHTASHTTWGEIAAGDRINLEIDILARYIDRSQSYAAGEKPEMSWRSPKAAAKNIDANVSGAP